MAQLSEMDTPTGKWARQTVKLKKDQNTMSKCIRKPEIVQKKKQAFNQTPSKPSGQAVYTANLIVDSSTIKIDILNSSKACPTTEFQHTPENIQAILDLFTFESVKGVRLSGKKGHCQVLAEAFLKQGIRPLIANSAKSQVKGIKGMPVINEHVAGIDIGRSVIYVAIPSDFDEDHTRVFGTFTEDLEAIVSWLKEHGINEVAMESTSVYWIPLYLLCEQHGIKPIIVNPKHVKMLPGRKTDVLDSQWLMRLLACGLLSAGFVPPEFIRDMRDLARHRQDLTGRAGDCLNLIQKMLALMNIQLGNVLSDISGKSGMAIIKAIADGQRDPAALATLADDRCKCSKEEITKSLVGTYGEAHIFIMKQELDTYEYLHKGIVRIELKIKELLENLPTKPDLPPLPESSKRRKEKRDYNRSPYCFDMRTLLYQKFGYDLTALKGVEDNTAATLIFETGGDVSAFPTSKHFASWNGTSPGNKVSGGKVLSGKAPKKVTRVGQALRNAANANYRADSGTGAYLRRLVRNGKSKTAARKATAHRLGTQVYNMMKFGQPYVEKGAAEYEKRHEERKIIGMTRALEELGYDVIKRVA